MCKERVAAARDFLGMETTAQYRDFAEKCDRLVEETKDPRHKRLLQEMAQAWRALAEAEEKRA